MRRKLLFTLGCVVHVLAYVAVIRVSDAIAGSSGVLGLVALITLLGLMEVGPLRWTDRVTGITQWRRRKWRPRPAETRSS